MIPHRPARAVLLAALVALGACSDNSTQPTSAIKIGPPSNLRVSATCKVGEIYQIVSWLTPLRNAPLNLSGTTTLVLSLSTSQQKFAQRLALDLAAALTPQVIAKLNVPPNPPFASREDAVATLISDVMQCTGLPATDAPPAGAYAFTGGLKVIGSAGGQLITGDLQTGFDVPAGAVTGPHLFAISMVDPRREEGTCVGYRERVLPVGRCYDYSVAPDVGAYDVERGTGFARAVFAAICSPGHEGQEVHTYLQVAKANHGRAGFTIYPRSEDLAFTTKLHCIPADDVLPPTASLGTRIWHGLEQLVSPSVAYASNGLGADLLEFTRATLVYQSITLTVAPANATVIVGYTLPLSVSGARPGPYTWSVNGVDMGGDVSYPAGTVYFDNEINSAVYLAPQIVPDGGAVVNVCARRTAAPADRGCSTITLVNTP